MKSVSHSIPGIPSLRLLLGTFHRQPDIPGAELRRKGVCPSSAVIAVRFEVWIPPRAKIIEWIVSNQPWCAQFVTTPELTWVENMSETLSGAVRQKEVLEVCSSSRTARFPTALVETEMIDSDPMLFWYSSCAWTRFEHGILNSFTSTERAGSVDICHIYIEMSTPPACVCGSSLREKKCSQNRFNGQKTLLARDRVGLKFWA